MEKVEKDLFGEDQMPVYHKIVTGIDKKDVIKEEKKVFNGNYTMKL